MLDGALDYTATAIVMPIQTKNPLPHILVIRTPHSSPELAAWQHVSNLHIVHDCVGVGSALTHLSDTAFDLIIVMAEGDGASGLSMITQITQLVPDVPIVLAVDSPAAHTAKLAIEANVSDYTSCHYVARSFDVVVQRNLTRQRVLKRRLLKTQQQIKSTTQNLLDAMLCALDFRDNETEGHSERVTAYALMMADTMGLSEREALNVERAAMLHDIGKIGVPDRILHKPGKLTNEERSIMQQHPILGFHMCAKIDALRGAARIVLHHHEHWDGNGYPDGLAGERIPQGARLFAVVDAYDAMTSKRIYRDEISHDEACEELLRCSGTQFDPRAVRAFFEISQQRLIQVREELSQSSLRLLWNTTPLPVEA